MKKRFTDEPVFMAALTNFRPFTQQSVEVGFVIVTADSDGGMIDIQAHYAEAGRRLALAGWRNAGGRGRA